ncbi:Mpp10 protein [Niveomyces insectorum RCEF 264]|uniref:Mpp10 protein n=1 Tax=Niveomyces insectorum RCEF 264 TaxID=1081102 RepID=A0A167VFE2_9HYPO|nr:Mpp10 protein [Niveomyces insectorum RCEF 264]
MAESSTSSLTSTSHTLTVGTVMATSAAGGNSSSNNNNNNNNNGVGSIGGLPSLSDISAALAFRDALRQPHRQTFLKPPPALPTAAAQFAQAALGAFASQLGDEQQEQRARCSRSDAKQVLEELDPEEGDDEDDEDDDEAAEKAERVGENGVTGSESDEDEVGSEEERLSAELDDDAEEEEDFDEDDEDEELGLDEDDEDDEEEDEEEGDEVDEDNGDDDDDDEDDLNLPKKVFVEDQHGLNDGFFDIDEFNKVSQWFEAQDAQADPNTDRADDDDEELDWHADPFSVAATGKRKAPAKKGAAAAANKRAETKKKGRRGQPDSDDEEAALRKAIMNEEGAGDNGDGDDDDDDDDEEDGPPIFGDMDLDAPSGESDNEDMNGDLDGEDLTANDIYYKDFFAPPPRKRQQDNGGAHRPGRPTAADAAAATKARAYQPDDRDVKRAMADVRRDLFEQISDASDVDDDDGVDGDDDDEDVGALSDASASDPRARRSTHARRQAKILAEIRRLEAAALQAKDWTLQGEAGAGARPINSLLEEELDFEHMGKPVPVITQEVSEDIEALVKRRIVAREFDEVRRRYATDLADESSAQRRGLIEIDDQPGKRGLAAVYEDAHQEAAHPDAYVRPADAQLAADEAESGLPVARDEMTREEKKRRRRRAKERIRKSGSGAMNGANHAATNGGSSSSATTATANGKGAGAAGATARETMATLQKAGVKVINRKGEIQDLAGNTPRAAQAVSGGNFKL